MYKNIGHNAVYFFFDLFEDFKQFDIGDFNVIVKAIVN